MWPPKEVAAIDAPLTTPRPDAPQHSPPPSTFPPPLHSNPSPTPLPEPITVISLRMVMQLSLYFCLRKSGASTADYTVHCSNLCLLSGIIVAGASTADYTVHCSNLCLLSGIIVAGASTADYTVHCSNLCLLSGIIVAGASTADYTVHCSNLCLLSGIIVAGASTADYTVHCSNLCLLSGIIVAGASTADYTVHCSNLCLLSGIIVAGASTAKCTVHCSDLCILSGVIVAGASSADYTVHCSDLCILSGVIVAGASTAKNVLVLLIVSYQSIARSQQHVSTEGLSSNLVSDHSTPPLNTLKNLMKMLETCGLEESRSLKREFLSVANVTCNDGSPAGRANAASLLPTTAALSHILIRAKTARGWYCYDQRSCHNRWMRLRHLMTSKQWPETRTVGGILSPSPEENPFWWSANHVFVPYCSSDTWSGTRSRPSSDTKFTFMGATIVNQVVRDLLPLGLTNASTVLLAGSSAGGTGVIINMDHVKALLHDTFGLRHIEIRGVSDSGWFLDRAPYTVDSHSLAPLDAVRRGLVLWQGQVSSRCQQHFPDEPWRCYFGYRSYPTLTAPLFVFQWLFDEAQMTADNVGPPVTKQQWDYIHKMGDSLRHSFHNVTSSPAMLGDAPLTSSLRLTLRNLMRISHYKISTTNASTTTEPQERRRRRRKKHSKNRNRADRNKGKKKKGRKTNRRREQRSVWSIKEGDETCQQRLVERCSWPQCNHSCPKLHNPFTGEEMDFIELLKSFGLDMMSVANALGIDIHTLNNMDHEELLNLLTQQAN
uniref:Palmitoleoyl-protein carboxylesterase NOTUM n=1 Tax=Timema bartmani TaxID=61472 RepID=A0A7R9F4F0_9NEOP|nr:unnamed protein product [Timema bartmani]